MHAPRSVGEQWATAYHAPVMVGEVLELLSNATRVLDGTLGGGGHSHALLNQGAIVTALDRDPQALSSARERLSEFSDAGRFKAMRGNFAEIDQIAALDECIFDGILLDLGVSSVQLDHAERGFSFREGAPLDMRMAGEEGGMTAAEWLSKAHEAELALAFREYADEPRAMRLAREIVRRRARKPFTSSDDLVGAIRGALGARTGPSDFARLFQAVRIAINDELGALERALPVLRDRLEPGGVIAAISYHSGEDRLVKRAMREWSAECICPPRQPVCTCRGRPLGRTLTRRAITASAKETEKNPRARSARLRAWQRAAA